MLGANPHGYQLWAAVGILHRLDRVFRRKSPHHQGQFAVSRRLDGKPIDPQHVLRSVSTAAVDFYNKLDIFHGSLPGFRSVFFDLSYRCRMDLDQLGFAVENIPSGLAVS
jgi:hypothetical protein